MHGCSLEAYYRQLLEIVTSLWPLSNHMRHLSTEEGNGAQEQRLLHYFPLQSYRKFRIFYRSILNSSPIIIPLLLWWQFDITSLPRYDITSRYLREFRNSPCCVQNSCQRNSRRNWQKKNTLLIILSYRDQRMISFSGWRNLLSSSTLYRCFWVE